MKEVTLDEIKTISPIQLQPISYILAILFSIFPEEVVMNTNPKDIIKGFLKADVQKNNIEIIKKIEKYVEKYHDFGISVTVVDNP